MLICGAALLVSACAGSDDEAGSASSGPTTSAATSTAVPSSEVFTSDEIPTSTAATPSTTAAPTTVATSTPASSTSAATTTPADECEVEAMLAVADQAVADARLEGGGEWIIDEPGGPFDQRTNTAEEFRYRMGFDCAIRARQVTADGHERFVLAAWTGDRRAFVFQASDPPSEPFAESVNFQLMTETAYGEWLEEMFVWAGTMAGGESIIVGAVDTSVALAAKSWQSAVPRFVDLPVTIEVERDAIDTLVDAGARNVSVAEPSDSGLQIAAIQFITPRGLPLIATVATPDWFDPAAELFPGERTVEQISGVDVHVNRGDPDAYAVGSVGWTCGEYVWFIDSTWGTIDEVIGWTGDLIDSAECESARLE